MSQIIYDEIIDVKEMHFNEKNITFKTQKFLYLTNLFINHHYIIGSC